MNVIDEMIVLNHLDIFKLNGFEFKYDENAQPMHRLSLISYPFSKNTYLGVEGMKNYLILLMNEN